MRRGPEPRSNIAPRFLTLTPPDTNNCKMPTFGCRLSLRKYTTNVLLKRLEVRAEFVSLLLGQFVVNHLPSTSFETFDGHSQLQKVGISRLYEHQWILLLKLRSDFICQQPRWAFRQGIGLFHSGQASTKEAE
jgi:hypothetical protein